MRTSKRYTNTTFTRRVDHEAGSHRGPAAAAGTRVCARCAAVWVNRRWSAGATPRTKSLRALTVGTPVLCPGCRMIRDGRFSGEVRLSGSFLSAHRREVDRLIRNEAERAAEDNPTAQIAAWITDDPARVVVRTTTEHLAKRLGQALRKAFDGTVRYRFSHENKFAHVTWTRSD